MGPDDVSLTAPWPQAEIIRSDRLLLDPLRVDHATSMLGVLSDPSLYRYTGGEAPSLQQLSARYLRQTVGHSIDESQGWLNWIVTLNSTGEPIGFVQATVQYQQSQPSQQSRQSELVADIAWVISPAWQGLGYASEATTAMIAWLRSHRIAGVTAHIHPKNAASNAVARHHGLVPASEHVDGETRWVEPGPHTPVTSDEAGGPVL